MTACKHLAWLEVIHKGDTPALVDHGRLQTFAKDLPDPDLQFPYMLFFIGGNTRLRAMRELYPEDRLGSGRRCGIATIRIDRGSTDDTHPIFIAEGFPGSKQSLVREAALCNEADVYPIDWPVASDTNLMAMIFSRLFCRFTDIICIFAEDYPEFQDILDLLESWSNNVDGLVVSVPRVILITRRNKIDVLDECKLRESRKWYSGLNILCLDEVNPTTGYGNRNEFKYLQDMLVGHVKDLAHSKKDRHCHFSATHLASLFKLSISQFTANHSIPIDYVKMARILNPVDEAHKKHMSCFVGLGHRFGITQEAVLTYIATTLLLDAYPPEMHAFDPSLVFDTLYRPSCTQVITESGIEILSGERAEYRIEDCLIEMFYEMLTSNKSAVEIYCQQVSRLRIDWRRLKSCTTCLYCLRRAPQDALSCGHAICETCILIHGEEVVAMDNRYRLNSCILCNSGSVDRVLRPCSAGLRILSLDGGGAWGRVSLEIIKQFQDLMGPGLRFQHFFDACYGTSVGGIIVMMLFLRGLSVDRSIRIFEDMACQIFRDSRGRGGLIGRTRHALRCWYTDGSCDTTAIEGFLKVYLQSGARMFDMKPSIFKTKVGITAARISEPSLLLFTNYNGLRDSKGYEHPRFPTMEEEPFLWEIARATSAAPMFFRPIYIEGVGYAQDGAMSGHNNPVKITKWETERIDPGLPNPDLVISIGTGKSESNTSEKLRRALPGFVSRLCRGYKTTFDCEKQSEEFYNDLAPARREDLFRLNVDFSEGKLALDAYERMTEMKERVNESRMVHSRNDALFALIAASFYFELDALPTITNRNEYQCFGTIKCRHIGSSFVEFLAKVLPSGLYFMVGSTVREAYLGAIDLCPGCRRYRKKVQFKIRHLNQLMEIHIGNTERGSRKISAFPQTLQWFIDRQYLEANFGRPFHRNLQETKCAQCVDRISGSSLKRHALDSLFTINPKRRKHTHDWD